MDPKEKSFLDCLDESNDSSKDEVVEQVTEIAIRAAQKRCFEESVSVETYHNRGFIKDGELIANFLREGEQRDNITQLVVDNWSPDYFRPIETNTGIITMYGEEGNIGIYLITAERALGVEEIEQQLLKAITNYPKNFNGEKVTIYVFASFKDSEIADIISGEYYEFRGCFEFIHAMRGWVLLNYHRTIIFDIA